MNFDDEFWVPVIQAPGLQRLIMIALYAGSSALPQAWIGVESCFIYTLGINSISFILQDWILFHLYFANASCFIQISWMHLVSFILCESFFIYTSWILFHLYFRSIDETRFTNINLLLCEWIFENLVSFILPEWIFCESCFVYTSWMRLVSFILREWILFHLYFIQGEGEKEAGMFYVFLFCSYIV